jgi:Meckelin (Transmembrane protein 67)
MKCGTPMDTTAQVEIGTNIIVTCTYNVNNLIAMTGGKQWRGRTYQLLVKSEDGNYYDVGVLMPGSSQTIKRFFIEDTTSSTNSINLMTGFTLSFNYNSKSKLDTPTLAPIYTIVSIDSSSGISSAPLTTMTYEVLFTNDISSFWNGALISFIVISVIALIHTIAKTYIGYLNKKSPLQFFINFAGVYSLWLYHYLLFMTGYWFLFTKSAASPVFLLPSHSTSLYGAFYALVAIMVVLRLVWVIVDKAEKLSTEVFVINWERSEFKNSWREIFVINTLA